MMQRHRLVPNEFDPITALGEAGFGEEIRTRIDMFVGTKWLAGTRVRELNDNIAVFEVVPPRGLIVARANNKILLRKTSGFDWFFDDETERRLLTIGDRAGYYRTYGLGAKSAITEEDQIYDHQ